MNEGRDGMSFTPDVVLFVGAAVLTVAVMVVLGIFLARALRTERSVDERGRGGGA